MSYQTCGQVLGSGAGSSVVGSSVAESPFPKLNPMSDIGRSIPKPLFVAGGSDPPPTPNPFNTEVRDPKFSPKGLRATGRSQRRVWCEDGYCDFEPIALGRSLGVAWSSEACTKAADVRAKL